MFISYDDPSVKTGLIKLLDYFQYSSAFIQQEKFFNVLFLNIYSICNIR